MLRLIEFIDSLRSRSDVRVFDESDDWRIVLAKDDLVCDVIVPRDELKWYVWVKRQPDETESWFDTLSYEGEKDDTPQERIESAMATDILAFIDRSLASASFLPLRLYVEAEPE